MKLYVCAVFDRKINAYMNPQVFRSKGEATRAWMDAVGSEGAIRKHAEDYFFAFLAFYDDNTGRFENWQEVPDILMTALDCLTVDSSVN